MKLKLSEIQPGQYFLAQFGEFKTAYQRGGTRWAAYNVRPDGTTRNKSTRLDARTAYEICASKEEAITAAYGK